MVVFVIAVDFLEGVVTVCSAVSSLMVFFMSMMSSALMRDVSGGAADAAGRLVHEHTGVRGQVTLACRSSAGNWPMEAHITQATVATSGSMRLHGCRRWPYRR